MSQLWKIRMEGGSRTSSRMCEDEEREERGNSENKSMYSAKKKKMEKIADELSEKLYEIYECGYKEGYETATKDIEEEYDDER